MTLPFIDAKTAKQKLDAGAAVLIDVREPDEHAREHVPGARLAPLSTLERGGLSRTPATVAIFHCKSGMRTKANVEKLAAAGFSEAYCLEGGLEAWKAAGLPVRANSRAPLELMRQVQIAAGALVLLGVGLGFLVNPAFFGLCAFVGAGLTFAGASGWCGMALLLKQMPWNRSLSA